MNNISVKINKGQKVFNDALIFADLNLKIDHPGLYIITGKSGCGKSTLLNIIAGFEKLTDGHLKTVGKVTMIFQNYELINELSITDNIFFKKKKLLTENDLSLLDKLGINEFIKRTPKELSFGQRQRIGIARALSQEPSIVLCDEPTESLDISNKLIVMDMLKEYSKDHIVLIVSHDKELIDKYKEVIYSFTDDGFKKVYDDDQNFKEVPYVKKKARLSIPSRIYKMTYRKTFVMMLSVLIIFGALYSLYSYKKAIFEIPDSNYTINADYLYIKSSSRLESLVNEYGEVTMIYDIKYAKINDEKIKMDIYPYHENEKVKLKGNAPKANEIVINDQIAADIGDKVTLEINTPLGIYEYEAVISGIVYERDALFKSMYYDLASLNDYFKSIKIDDEAYQYIDNLYDLILEYPSLYEKYVGYDKLHLYEDDANALMPLYDVRNIAVSDTFVFEFIFNGVLIIYIALMFIFTFIFNKKDGANFVYNASIMNANGVSLIKLKALYLAYKLLHILLALILSSGIIYLLYLGIFFKINYQLSEVLVLLFIMLVYYLFYYLSLLFGIRELKRNKIAIILKKQEL